MTRLILLLVFAALMGCGQEPEPKPAPVSDNPFGFGTQTHPLDYENCRSMSKQYGGQGYRGDAYECESAPRPHPDLTEYWLEFVEGVGVCAIEGRADELRSEQASDLEIRLIAQIKAKYGLGDPQTADIRQPSRREFLGTYVWVKPTGASGWMTVTKIELTASRSEEYAIPRSWVTVRMQLETAEACQTRLDKLGQQAL